MSTATHNTSSLHQPVEPPRVSLTGNAQSSRLAGCTVMVIDDSMTIRRSAEIMLKQAGCSVVLANDGFEALEKVALHKPDLIFVDVLMPRLNGYQTCALLKRSGAHRHIPVVMLSSKDGIYDRAIGNAAGSNQYLTKPFNKETLLMAVEAHIRARDAGRARLHS